MSLGLQEGERETVTCGSQNCSLCDPLIYDGAHSMSPHLPEAPEVARGILSEALAYEGRGGKNPKCDVYSKRPVRLCSGCLGRVLKP